MGPIQLSVAKGWDMETVQALPTKPLAKESVEERLMGQELFLFDGEDIRCAVHTLNSGAALIWMLCDGSRDLDDMAQEIAGAYDLSPQEVLSHVQKTVAQFQSLGLLES